MRHKILVINPGSLSTKVALYENENAIYKKAIEHPIEELEIYKKIIDQFNFRLASVMDFLKEIGVTPKELTCIVSRGGFLPPVKSGAYIINKEMVDFLRFRPTGQHASNLGAIIAYEIAAPHNIPAYIYDCLCVDEMEPIAKISGLKEVERKSFVHILNMRAMAIKTASKIGKSYTDLNLIILHLGGGVSLAILKKGKVVDMITDDEGPFTPERCGTLPGKEFVGLCYEKGIPTVEKMLRGRGGFVSYFGTSNTLEVEERIRKGDQYAKLVFEAMAYQIAKSIGELATVVNGEVDRIILTGGVAHSEMLMGWVKKRVEFIAPVVIAPGENEMEALAFGALRVIRNEEDAHVFNGKELLRS
jgi:butyrate kinase